MASSWVRSEIQKIETRFLYAKLWKWKKNLYLNRFCCKYQDSEFVIAINLNVERFLKSDVFNMPFFECVFVWIRIKTEWLIDHVSAKKQ